MIGLVTDSASQMPPDLASRLGVEVVPVIVTLDGERFLEGVDLTPSDFWSRFAAYGTADGDAPEVSTSQPSPGEIATAYRRLAERGATEIVSVHVGADHSGTLNAARLAAELVDLPVHLVDSGTASFGVSCCVWEAAEVLARDGSAAEAATRAKEAAASVGTTFLIQALEFARAGGRWDDRLPDDHDGVMVLGGLGGAADLLATGHTVDELCDHMVEPMLRDGVPIRAGVSLADPATIVFTEGIESRLRESAVDVDLVRYEVGASIGAHTGPGTAGGFWYPVG
ncbi:MAG: DegV family protein [Acidimicrobiales bacterium]|nr:DegV family protein [Acidimicrobiales bacterium]